jgi:protein-tyrosine phosphatase
MVKVLFVCLGNICRSPTAEGVFRKLVQQEGLEQHIEIDSAGTHAYHVGEPPDARARQAAARRGVELDSLRGRQVDEGDFYVFDYVLAMDLSNHANLADICPPGMEHKLSLFLDYAPELREQEVPDPYFGGDAGFERVLDMIEDASRGLLQDIRTRLE